MMIAKILWNSLQEFGVIGRNTTLLKQNIHSTDKIDSSVIDLKIFGHILGFLTYGGFVDVEVDRLRTTVISVSRLTIVM